MNFNYRLADRRAMMLKMYGLSFLFLVCLWLCCSGVALAKPITLSWRHNDLSKPENKDMIGYHLYRTTEIRRGKGYYVGATSIASIPVGTNIVTVEVPDVDCNFALTAYNKDVQSKLSNEAVYTSKAAPPVEKLPAEPTIPSMPTGLTIE
jgi:hypothetical protein